MEGTSSGPVDARNRFTNFESQSHISIHALMDHDLSRLNLGCTLAADDHDLVAHARVWDGCQVESSVLDMR